MESKEIRELASIMKEMGLTVLDYNCDGVAIRIERAAANIPEAMPKAIDAQPPEERYEESATAGGFVVKSPMVGVFYSAPGVDKKPYVAVGDAVHEGDVLCIIEVMKIMNEIIAERDGVVTEICVENKQVVEFGQTLFRMESD